MAKILQPSLQTMPFKIFLLEPRLSLPEICVALLLQLGELLTQALFSVLVQILFFAYKSQVQKPE